MQKATFHCYEINRYTALPGLDVAYRDTDVETEAQWAERSGARPTELDFISDFTRNQILFSCQYSYYYYEYF